mmetsp:Transcript_4739/g.13809  ORF Transcript_4739/g.13809 Transcript_4739/m.13809 type:complete len:187 (-) Transcript_4739:420-980(-)
MLRGRPHTGVVTTWVEEKGYGFISPNDAKTGDLFVHVDSILDRTIKKLHRGDRVRFDVELNTNPTKNSGKKFAVNVELMNSRMGGSKKDDRDRSEDRDRRRDKNDRGGDKGRSRSRRRSPSQRRSRSGSSKSSRGRSSRGRSSRCSRHRSRLRSRQQSFPRRSRLRRSPPPPQLPSTWSGSCTCQR